MTDREMLEMAARAAGTCLHPPGKLHTSYGNWGSDTTCTVCGNDPSAAMWNPLTDDGDALRLAVKLKLCVSIEFDRVDVTTPQMDNATEYFYDNPPTDPYAATRRAIVRAAAAIGKEMKP